jgi:glycogen(starch) synthase
MTADAVGGVWRYCIDLLAELLTRKPAEILLVTMGPRPTAAQKTEIESLGYVTLIESAYALEWMPDSARDVATAGKWLLQLEDEFEPDVIHLNGYAHAVLPWRHPVIVVAHSCVYSWWKSLHGTMPGPEWYAYKTRVVEGLEAADTVIAPSRSMASHLTEFYGLQPERVEVIRNFTRDVRSTPASKKPFCFAAGRVWDRAKNLSLLEEIAPRVTLPIRIAGDNNGPNGEKSTYTRSVELLGPLSHTHVLRQMQRAEIFLHPALYEPFGLAVLEAAQSSCALLLSDIDSLRELWGDAAVFVNPHDPEHWIFEIQRLSGDCLRARQLGQRARIQTQSFSASDSAARYWSVYDRLLDNSHHEQLQFTGMAV